MKRWLSIAQGGNLFPTIIQWGFYMHVKCSLRTDEETLVL